MLEYTQMTDTIIEKITQQLMGDTNPLTIQEIKQKYPIRQLPIGAEVMRVPPSPTGFVHIGTVYAALINERIAHQSSGVFILRIEDTDKKREVEGSVGSILSVFEYFGLRYDEGPVVGGLYGPYFQSERANIYHAYALELLRTGRAYPCFATKEELDESYKAQQLAKVRPGYYGEWALWRDRSDDEILAALDAGKPYVLRFKSHGNHEKRITYEDIFKGHMEVPENDLDVPLIKSDGTKLPTYHLAHVVDDFLMGTTKVFRSDEWLPSTALHVELSQALGQKPFTYGHFAPISVNDKNGGGKRKLSKRKDDEANVEFWITAGYPLEGIKAYLLGLANSNFEDWYRTHPGEPLEKFEISLLKLAASRSPLLDMGKLEDYCKEFMAALPQEEFEQRLIEAQTKETFKKALQANRTYTHAVLSIERNGDKPRKDLAKWNEAYAAYGYFFDEIFKLEFAPEIEVLLSDLNPGVVTAAIKAFLNSYNPKDDQQTWFETLKVAAESCGFATDNKAYKLNPTSYPGNVASFARILRVKLTGRDRTPDLWTIMQVMDSDGSSRITSRLQG